jgi:hypothetical protein
MCLCERAEKQSAHEVAANDALQGPGQDGPSHRQGRGSRHSHPDWRCRAGRRSTILRTRLPRISSSHATANADPDQGGPMRPAPRAKRGLGPKSPARQCSFVSSTFYRGPLLCFEALRGPSGQSRRFDAPLATSGRPHHLWAGADPLNVEPRPDFASRPLKASLSELVNWVYNRVSI